MSLSMESTMTKKSRSKISKKGSSKDAIFKKLELADKCKLSQADMVWMLRNIYTSRKIDDTEILMKKQMKAFFQISGAGHEGIQTALAKALEPRKDWLAPYYRDRAFCLGLGVTPYEMLCQANGNVGDTATHGRQMPAHYGSTKFNIFNSSSCTGTQFLQAVGSAEAGRYLESLALKDTPVYHKGEVTVVTTGDGTTSQGEFWEALTTASIHKLPVIFLVEDNGYAISVPVKVQTPAGSISKALKDFPDLEIIEVDGNCPIESYAASLKAVEHARKGKGPVLFHAHVTRPYSHSMSDDHSMYRTKEELTEEASRDVLVTYPNFLKEAGILSDAELEKLFKDVETEVREAMKKAVETEWPAPETYKDHLLSDKVDMTSSEFDTDPKLTGKDDIPMAGAINTVLKQEVAKNPLIRVFGEDVADFSQLEKLDDESLKGKGGVFKLTSGVQRVGKPGQVFNSPLAEANIVGRAIGMAMRGLKPVVEIQFFDYIWTAFMQLKNEMATTRYRSGGEWKSPMVVRVPIGGYLKGGSIYHSQSGETFFTHIPGIHVAYPSNALDAAGLLRTAIRGDDPVMFLEHKHLYYQGYNRCASFDEDFMLPFGKARIVREGKDATVVCWGALVQKSVEAAKALANEGYEIEIIDARTLAPFDMEAVKTSLAKTNRLLIAHEDIQTCGYAGEIAARVNEECFESLDAPIMRVAAKDTPVAYNPGLEDVILPQIADVTEKLKTLLNY